jgi:hypothetical protein
MITRTAIHMDDETMIHANNMRDCQCLVIGQYDSKLNIWVETETQRQKLIEAINQLEIKEVK